MREFGKVYNAFWESDKIAGLSGDAKLLALYLMTCKHCTAIGAFRLPDGYVREDMRWTDELLASAFDELESCGFCSRDATSKWVVIHKHLLHNQIENPNQGKAIIASFQQIPENSGIKSLVAEALRNYSKHVSETVYKPFLNPFETVGVTVTETLSETVPEGVSKQEEEEEGEEEGDIRNTTRENEISLRAWRPPSKLEIGEYLQCRGIENPFEEAERFFNQYASTGWKRSGSQITDWKMVANDWEPRKSHARGPTKTPSESAIDQAKRLFGEGP